MELTKKDTQMMQGFSVLAMVFLHLFDRWDYEGLFTPLVFLHGIPLSFYFGQLSDFCVMGFAFCSGYAHMKLYGTADYYKKRLKGLLNLYSRVWIILILFTSISMATGNKSDIPGSLFEFFMNFLTLWTTYNGAWWYVFTYAIITVLSPFLLKMVKNRNTVALLGVTFFIYCAAYYFRFELDAQNWFLQQFGRFGMTVWEYLIGAACFKEQWFQKVRSFCDRQNKALVYTISVVLFLGMMLGHTLIVGNVIIAPVTGLILLYLFWSWKKPKMIEQFFLLIGTHSTNIWLTHMFFYAVLFKDLVYIAQEPILIFALMICITLVVSVVVNVIQNPVQRAINKI